MGINMILDYGHRLTTSGKQTVALPRIIKERTMNEGYGTVAAQLFRQAGCNVLEVAPDKNAVMNEKEDLNRRISRANQWAAQTEGDSYYISCHANAGGGQGAEIWIYSKAKQGGMEERLAGSILKKLCAATGMKNRGVKRGYAGNPKGDFAVNRDTKMPAMLIECGFMDYIPEARKMDNPEFWKVCGTAVFEGAAEVLGLSKPAAPNASVLYNVMFGECSEGDKNTAVALGEKLGLETTAIPSQNGLWYVKYSPMSEGDKNAVEQLGSRLAVDVMASSL